MACLSKRYYKKRYKKLTPLLKKASTFKNWRITYGIFNDFAFKDEVLKNGVFDYGLY